MKTDKIYLVGFMAAGKTRWRGRWRGGWAGRRWTSTSSSSHASRPVAEIFARHGETYFRAVERRVLLDQFAPRHLVVATGGGTFADPQNRAAINGDGVSVWLDVPLERLIERVPADGRRPLAADRAASNTCIISGAPLRTGAHAARRRPGALTRWSNSSWTG